MPVFRATLFAAAALASLVFLGLSAAPPLLAQSDVATSGADPVASAVQEPSKLDGDASESVGGSAESGPNFDNPQVESAGKKWTARVDEAFGEYIVAPIETVLFYDFHSGPRSGPELGDDGQPVIHPGWLVTGSYPNGISLPFVVVWLFFGATFLTLRMGFINFRAFRHAIDLTRGVYDNPDEPGEVSHFQALSAALSATVGLGNIAGVAIAIGTGGPGATFWIIVVGLLGMTAKFTECTLGQLYRVSDADGHVLGGPMRYLKSGLSELGLGTLGKVLSVSFMILCIGASFGGGNAFQVGQSLEAIRGEISVLQEHPYVYGLVMAAAVGAVIVGGIRSIGAVAGRLVPLMCLAYVAASIYILIVNFSAIPSAITQIVSEAFSPQAAYGGFLGVVIIGIQRAVFSNEAGVGSAAIAHSAARTDEPVSEGIVALLEPFIDTVVVCTITALVLVVSGAYNSDAFVSRQAPETVVEAVQGVSNVGPVDEAQVASAKATLQETIDSRRGAAMTLVAFRSCGHVWFGYILFAAVILFAFSTCISWSYYGERCWVELFGERFSIVYKLLFLVFTVLGSIVTRGNILAFSDLMLLGMSFPNLLGVFLLSGLVKRKLDEYWSKYESGQLVPADRT